MKPIPELNREYHIFDDGKIKPSRHYTALIKDYIPFEECTDEGLLNAWREQASECNHLFAEFTDYFVVAISDYDANPLYFVRTNGGGWFSLDYPNWWMGARLDIDGSLYKQMVEDYGEDEE